jgi:hsp70-interacting protein
MAREMPADRRKWLEQAMNELVVDEAKRMKDIVEQLSAAADGSFSEEAEALFEELQDICESLDSAWDLVKMGSMDALIEMLRASDPAYRAGAAQIISTCAQNNPKVQEALLHRGALAYATHMSVHDTEPSVRLKALGAVSSMVRGFPDGERAFVDQGDGLLVLTNGLTSDQPRFIAKCVHLLVFFLQEDSSLRDDKVLERHREVLNTVGTAELADGLMTHEDINVRLGSLQLLTKFVHDDERLGRMRARLEALESGSKEAKEDNQDEICLLRKMQK